MLTREIMGGLALAILWVNTLLVTAAALQELRDVLARLRSLRIAARRPPGGDGPRLVEARVTRGDGRGGALAGHRVEQVGRAGPEQAGRPTIVFADRTYSGEIYGGAASAEGRDLTIEPAIEAEIWVSRRELEEAAACPSQARFDEAYPHARKARGYSRALEARVRAGATVWLLGATRAAEGGAAGMTPTLISTINPRGWCGSRAALLVAFVGLTLAIAAGCTAVALTPPYFGLVSTIGGAACLAFFLLVQPAGTAARDAVRPPSRAIVRGRWIRDAAAAGARPPAPRAAPRRADEGEAPPGGRAGASG